MYEGANSVLCSVGECSTWFHLRCTEFSLAEYIDTTSRLHTDDWICPLCSHLPFSDLNPTEFAVHVSSNYTDLKTYFNSFPNRASYKTRCSVCTKKVTSNHQSNSLLCTGCTSFVHRKCSNISTYN